MELIKRGDLVKTLFDTGAMGATVLYGVVIAAGPRAFRVRWESGLTNRCPQVGTRVKLASDQDLARTLMAKSAAR